MSSFKFLLLFRTVLSVNNSVTVTSLRLIKIAVKHLSDSISLRQQIIGQSRQTKHKAIINNYIWLRVGMWETIANTSDTLHFYLTQIIVCWSIILSYAFHNFIKSSRAGFDGKILKEAIGNIKLARYLLKLSFVS